ncbi:outer membrane protein assembly factor BamA [Pseudofulvibacter geojedonensis]|uniref:Outer membrane protein assembly factor BamA n=1 Tax=Pseudofulvibacter geojedonensis TaxID=1123758 RepID=A0ABW3I6L7_9FLAO
MEKQVNNLSKKLSFLFILFVLGASVHAQEGNYTPGSKYIIEDITVSGNASFNKQTIVTYSGLRKGLSLVVPGEKTSNAIKKLWSSNLFSNVNIYVTKVDGNAIYLDIEVTELPTLNEVKITGIKKGKHDDIIKENNLKKGTRVTENLLTTTKNYLENKYAKEGYLKSKVYLNPVTTKDSTGKELVNLVVNIDRGDKVKIKNINFSGNESFASSKLKGAMKNTKQRNPIRIFKRSKFIEKDYQEDLKKIEAKYKESGFRDIKVTSSDPTYNEDETISLNIDIKEGKKYYIGDINFTGNTVYPDKFLRQKLGLYKGDIYNGVLLEKQIADASDPDADDLTNLYQNNGYLFSNIVPVEVGVRNDTIDFEIRISEGKLTHFKNISVVGNDKTNDHVIYRELRTKPGQVYSKQKIVRSLRELGQLGFFDAEQLSPNIKNPNPNEGTVDVEYSVVEKGSSQVELQGGFGGGGFIGTLGLSFNNFSIRNIFNKEAYKPLPMGDGQRLSLRAQASRFFQTYSFSFSEPWLGGRRPQQFSVSLSQTSQFRFDPVARDVDRDQRFLITGVTVGLARRLQVPDDYFTLSTAVSFQHYNLKNYQTGIFQNISNGFSNNLAFTVGLSRNSLSINPIFPTAGSKFGVTGKFSIPYSLFNGVDYADLERQREIAVEDNNRNALARIDQEKYKWLEFYKIKFDGDWYNTLYKKLVLRSNMQFGFLGAYNNDRGIIPFERFFVGGDGLGAFSLDGREAVGLRGYPNQSLSSTDGGTIFNKFSLELRHPITMNPSASIFALAFMEGGNSYNTFSDYNPFDIYRSAGAGIRIFMPAFGLLGIDFGYGFDTLPGQPKRNGWETHFILGQQF